MFCLVYRSLVSSQLKPHEINDLLENARIYNAKNDITGCLFLHQGKFLQYIEGDQDRILNLYNKIAMDKRHTEVTLLAYDFILERVFEDWKMHYEDFERKNERLEHLEMMLTLFSENPRTSLSSNRTSMAFWHMVKRILVKGFEN